MHLRRILLSALIACQPLSGRTAPTLPGVGAAIQDEIDAHEIAGAVTLVTTKDKIIHWEATGFADIANKKALETDALFWLASTTKMVTAVAVLMLQDEGRLNVADPVAKYLPEFAGLKSPSGKATNMTIAQLLTHTSGLPEIKRTAYAAAKDLTQLIDGYFPVPPLQFESGGQYKYTSVGFDVAGRIVEIVSGLSFDVFCRSDCLTR